MLMGWRGLGVGRRLRVAGGRSAGLAGGKRSTARRLLWSRAHRTLMCHRLTMMALSRSRMAGGVEEVRSSKRRSRACTPSLCISCGEEGRRGLERVACLVRGGKYLFRLGFWRGGPRHGKPTIQDLSALLNSSAKLGRHACA